MSDPFADRQLPRGVLLAAGALVAATLATVATVRLTGIAPVAPAESPALVSRDLRFVDQPGGAVAVIDTRDDREIARLEPGQDGFVRATLRTFARDRRNAGVPSEAPLRLASRADGRVTLDDPTTGRHVPVEAFGPAAAASFLRLLQAAPASPSPHAAAVAAATR